jgi:hypothetical protein
MVMEQQNDTHGRVPDLRTRQVCRFILEEALKAVQGGIVFVDLSTFKDEEFMRGILEGVRLYSKVYDHHGVLYRIILWHSTPVELETALNMNTLLSYYTTDLYKVFPGL